LSLGGCDCSGWWDGGDDCFEEGFIVFLVVDDILEFVGGFWRAKCGHEGIVLDLLFL
jgi:hypothetical protein